MKPSAYHEYILIKIYLKKKENWGLGGKGVRESNGRVRTDQSKIHSQCGYIKKSP
jgi:hypothetical protein